MQLSIAAVLAFASAALAQTAGFDPITKPIQGEMVPAGSTYQIVWLPSAAHPGSIKIGLLGGSSPSTLSVVATLATGVDGKAGSFDWQVDKALGTLATYGIMITLESDPNIFQYGFPFKITPSSTGGGSTSGNASISASSSVSTPIPLSTSISSTSSSSISTSISTSTTSSQSVSSSACDVLPSSSLSASSSGSLVPSVTGNGTIVATGSTSLTNPTNSPSPSTVLTSGAASLAASSFALIGVVAVAVLAL